MGQCCRASMEIIAHISLTCKNETKHFEAHSEIKHKLVTAVMKT